MTIQVNNTIIVDSNRNVSNVTNVTSTSTSHFKVPAGTTGERPQTPENGMFRYNSSIGDFEGYINGVWGPIGSSDSANVGVSGPIKTIPATKTAQQSTTAGSLQQVTDLSITITPTSSNSSIRIQGSINASIISTRMFSAGVISLFKNNTTEIVRGLLSGYHASGISGNPDFQYSTVISFEYIDYPNTTSPVTYGIYFGSSTTAANVVINATTVATPKSELLVEEYIY
jgi:hypothetical protein